MGTEGAVAAAVEAQGQAAVELPRVLGPAVEGETHDFWGFKLQEDAEVVSEALKAVWDAESHVAALDREWAVVVEAGQEITPATWQHMIGVALAVDRLHLRADGEEARA